MTLSRIISHIILIILMQLTGTVSSTALSQETKNNTIKIGLLVQDEKSVAARQAAALAIRKANEKGGMNGSEFQLVVRSMEGPWGTGSKQAVDLIFGENVWALLGSHDGRNAHLVEQAATKAGVVFISCWSGDPTLSQAFVPWFFNCVPNYSQQADILVNELYYIKKFSNIISVTDKTYDSNQAYLNFNKKTELSGNKISGHLIYDDYANKTDSIADNIIKGNHDCLLLFCSPVASSELIYLLSGRKFDKPVYGITFILNENELSEREMIRFDNVLKVPAGRWQATPAADFVREYRSLYGISPGLAATYVYDGMNALLEAIILAGSREREKIQYALAKMNFNGVSGPVQFDSRGNRSGPLYLTYLKNGMPLQ